MIERNLLGKIHVWRWPDGLLWRGALRCGARLRQARLEAFLRQFQPGANTSILDVGITNAVVGASNLLEREYPWAGSLTGCGLEGEPEICRQRGIRFVYADGCDLLFADGEFDIVHSNAVIEHVGNRERQRRFVSELSRVGQSLWLVTPDADGPMEPHTLIPFAHWLPRPMRSVIYNATGRGFFADEANLNLLSAGELRRIFPAPLRNRVVIRKQYVLGLPAILIATLQR